MIAIWTGPVARVETQELHARKAKLIWTIFTPSKHTSFPLKVPES